MTVPVKICGLIEPVTVAAAADAGARYLGFNFFPKSPRYVSPEQAAALMLDVPMGVAKVSLTVNADDATLDEIVNTTTTDMLQLHGSESPQRVAEVRARYGLPVLKAIGIADAADLDQIDIYSDVADQLLIDAKAPKGAVLPGGNGLAFDWELLRSRKYWTKPWLLAGGLTPQNAALALAKTGATQLDVSSGVESAPGVKDADMIRAFINAANAPAAPSLS
ncbi:phosphoribosylanthranilate isomerase [Octadecabacter sp. CECT 8868]|uniref:phosphoribosylanthranilate isomerase n=1 Tax=Octadecabacter algicola TaxID=2909342 RepID=UPI001F2A0582|nr:phosphoribosylanthranilate isomerase [Octadecabacter algicola]MCF2905153.1 phosphoribosylanthranilate isomerase [Octadecabacter algicola]